ncbi:MAG: YidB family protein [Chloroflexota bacterium]
MNDLAGMLGGLGGDGGNGGGDIVGAIGGLVSGHGGLEGLIGQLTSGGLGDVVNSWVGTGPNQHVDPAHLANALGNDKVSELAGKAGLPVEQFLPILASALPSIIDALTPDGKVSSGDAASGFDIGGILQGLGEAANAGANSPLGQLGNILGGFGKG